MSQTQELGQRALHEETQQLLARSEAREQAAAEQQQDFMAALQKLCTQVRMPCVRK